MEINTLVHYNFWKMKIKVLSLFLLSYCFSSLAQISDTIKKDSSITFLFVGDVMGHMPQVRAAYDSFNDKYDYNPCFSYIKQYIQDADVSIANLELVLGGTPYSGYPTFSSPDDVAVALKNAGIDVIALANNHCYDKGKYGFERTIKIIDSLNFLRMGTYNDIVEKYNNYPLIINLKGIKIAFFNYTYGTNGLKPQEPNIINYISLDKIKEDIKKADSLKCDLKILFIHWGLEYELQPNNEQIKLAKAFSTMGFDAIVGSHPHVVQSYDEIVINDSLSNIKKIPVLYSLGNFISNQRDRYRDCGVLFGIKFYLNNKGKFETFYIPYWVYKGHIKGKYQYYVIPIDDYLNNNLDFTLPESDYLRLKEASEDIEKQLFNLKRIENTIKNK